MSRSVLVVCLSLFMNVSWVWAQTNDGYVIVSSEDTLTGSQTCLKGCTQDDDCLAEELGRCVDLPNVGSVCMPIREGTPAPDDRQTCATSRVECGSAHTCVQLPGPSLIDAFVAHKTGRGFTVHVIDESEWGGGENGDQRADNIRAWLQSNYEALNIRYVLLIGDPRQTGDVPMRITKPGLHATQDWAIGAPFYISTEGVPTDYYFAELTGNWDLDGDGNLAEFAPINFVRVEDSGDFGEGGVDRVSEVSVGRIPYYGKPGDLDRILQKTMDYENADPDSIGWRTSALLAAEGANRIFFGEQSHSEVFLPNGYETYRVYDAHLCSEFGGAVPNCPVIDGEPDELTCSINNVKAGIEAFEPGMVMWLTHGGGSGAAAVMNTPTARLLPDDKPFFTFQASCLNSKPAVTANISYELLLNGAIGTIGATVISHGPGSEVVLRNSAGNAGMGYAYAKRMVEMDMTAGDALASLRGDIGVQNRWWYWRNYVAFNLWGDPSVGLTSHALPEAEPEPEPDAGMIEPSDVGMVESDMGDDTLDASVAAMDAGIVADQNMSDLMLPPTIDGGEIDGAVPESDSGGDPEPPEMTGDSGGCYSAAPGGLPIVGVLAMGLILGVGRRWSMVH